LGAASTERHDAEDVLLNLRNNLSSGAVWPERRRRERHDAEDVLLNLRNNLSSGAVWPERRRRERHNGEDAPLDLRNDLSQRQRHDVAGAASAERHGRNPTTRHSGAAGIRRRAGAAGASPRSRLRGRYQPIQ
jgi:hypothetical protein